VSDADAATVSAIKDEFLQRLQRAAGPIDPSAPVDPSAVRNMSPNEAFDLKVAHQNKARQMKVGAYQAGADNGAGVSAHQTIAGSLGDQLVDQFPEAAGLNARYSRLAKAEAPLDSAANRAANANPFSLASILSTAAGVMTGRPLTGAAAGIAVKVLG